MNRFRPLILLAVSVLCAFVAYGLFSRPKVEPALSDGLSAERVAGDIRIISRKPHSVAAPAERAEVREYLYDRLLSIGADTVKVFRHDSLVGPENKHVVYTFDAYNLLAEFAPRKEAEDTTYLLLIAHYDSRYSQPMPKDTVWSYGAADDGYGVGSILEVVSKLVNFRDDWNQGVKVLFTDAEEPGLKGMTALWNDNREEFDDVGLVINVEARGTWGPCLMFEACAGNSKVMEFYRDYSEYHFTYSLTTVVYSFMPNFTDFTVIKDELPGLNFSCISDINHYHTDLDNYDNISPKTIQHYLAQIYPLAIEYVTNGKYSDRDYFRSGEDMVNFTIPALGMFNFTKGGYLWLNIAVFVLFLIVLFLEAMRYRIKIGRVLTRSARVLGLSVAVLALGEGVAFLSCVVSGATFKPFGIVQGVRFDNAAMIVSMVLLLLVSAGVYWKRRGKNKDYADNALQGTLFLMFVLSAALLFAIGENLMFFIPLLCSVAALSLYRVSGLKLFLVLGMVPVLLHAFSFLFALSMALTIGAFGAVAMIGFIDMMALIPLADMYIGKK